MKLSTNSVYIIITTLLSACAISFSIDPTNTPTVKPINIPIGKPTSTKVATLEYEVANQTR